MTKPVIYLVLTAVFIISAGSAAKETSSVKPPQGYVLIPAGTADIAGNSVTFQAFYMSQAEITNGQYLEFLTDLKTKGKSAEYEKVQLMKFKFLFAGGTPSVRRWGSDQ